MTDNEITVIYGDDPKEMTLALLRGIGVINDIPKDASIGLKPNLVQR